MKVLHVITGLAYGGAETHLASSVRHSRHTSEVLGLYDRGFAFEQLQASGTAVRDFEMTSNRQVGAVPRLVRTITKGGYDVVHAHLFRAQIYARIAARLAKTPVIVSTEHSLGETQLEGRPATRTIRLLYTRTERLGDCTIAVSDRVRERLVAWGIDGQRIVTIPIGIDLGRYLFDPTARRKTRASLGIGQRQLVIGTVGRLVPIKRMGLLLNATREILADGALLLIVGDGPEEGKLRDLVRQHGLGPSVVFAGKQRNIPAMLAAMDVFVATSADETYGLAAVEALAAGLPVVVTVCPALERSGIRSVFWTAGDQVQIKKAIVAATRTLGNDRDRPPAELGQYDVRQTTAITDELYENLYRSSRRHRHSSRSFRSL